MWPNATSGVYVKHDELFLCDYTSQCIYRVAQRRHKVGCPCLKGSTFRPLWVCLSCWHQHSGALGPLSRKTRGP